MALAIGCAAAVLTLTDAVLFRPTGVNDPSRVAAVYSLSSVNSRYLSDSYPDFRDVASLTDMVDSAAAYLRMKLNVRLTAGVESMNMELVTGDYFRAAGIAPVLGRPLAPEDDRPGAAPVALASYALWENRYQRSPSILGSAVRMNGVSFTIVGVMPPGYQGMLLDWYAEPSFWAPLTHFKQLVAGNVVDYENRREVQMLMMLATSSSRRQYAAISSGAGRDGGSVPPPRLSSGGAARGPGALLSRLPRGHHPVSVDAARGFDSGCGHRLFQPGQPAAGPLRGAPS